jgi:catechol 2,3-dioxygenase-like lactoylglutathione lyase family enzyme
VIDHVSVGVRDLARAGAFYARVLGVLGYAALERRPATIGFGKSYPDFWINLRAEMAPLPAEFGGHACLRARSREVVDAFHAAALAAGGESDGAPGFRPQHGAGYYSAFVRDLDGNRIEAVTFVKEGDA